jgi:serine/threonine-protein kinase
MRDPNIGRLLANRYHLVDMVGEGAMGRVYRGEDTVLGGVTVAIKFLSQMLSNEKMRSRFEREATISALLGEKSIHIVRVKDYGVDNNDCPFYVMEFLQGKGLNDLIQSETIDLKRFFVFMRHICLGMEAAHQGIMYRGELCPIIHRDIKPSNMLIIQEPTLGELVKILDFGIAKLIQTSGTMTHSFMGTLAYCSPEQMEGKELDNRSDIYSLGIMMYEMLTGEMPLLPDNSSFGGWYKAHHYTPPEPFDPDCNVPQSLQNLVMKCLAKSPNDRPQNIGEIIQALDAISNNSPIPSFPPRPSILLPSKDNLEETTRISILSIDEVCLQSSWPKDKPQQKIVFPRLIRTPQGIYTTLWVMLENEDIIKRKSSTRYNQFLFLTNPHPMVLWITVLYNREYGPRWLPCYLDLKSTAGQQLAKILADTGSYRILFFALDQSAHCQNVMTSTIAPRQCRMLNDWVMASKAVKSENKPQISKKRLKDEFERLKPKIITKLEALRSGHTDISG